jgi:hypothetical protein
MIACVVLVPMAGGLAIGALGRYSDLNDHRDQTPQASGHRRPGRAGGPRAAPIACLRASSGLRSDYRFHGG